MPKRTPSTLPDPETEAHDEVTGNGTMSTFEEAAEPVLDENYVGGKAELADGQARAVAAKQRVAQRRSSSTSLFGSLEEDTDYIKWLMYGPEGSGKTTSACRASRFGKILVIRAEGGLKKIALTAQGCNVSNIQVFPKTQGARISKDDLEAVHEQVLSDLQRDPDSWFAVVIDSVSEVVQTLREDATDKRVNKTLGKLRGNAEALAEFDPEFVDRDDYGVMTNQLRRILRRYRDLPCHVVMTALIKVDDDTKENTPNLTPALRADLLGYVDIVTAHKADDDEFRALTRKSDKTKAKDRFGILPKVWAEPNFDRLMSYMAGEFVNGGDDIQDAFEQTMEQRRQAAEAAAAAKVEAKKAVRSRTTARKTAEPKTSDA